MGEIVLVRHGETEWSRTGLHTGRTDVALTRVGERQAQRVAEALQDRHFVLVLTSPLARAAETARLAGLTGAVADPDLAEWDYGEFEGRSTHEIREQVPGWDVWSADIRQGEPIAQVGVRADRVIARVAPLLDDGDVALVGHGHALRVLGARWMGLPAHAGGQLALDTATVSVLGHERERRVIQAWNAPVG